MPARILILEDNPDNLHLMSYLLKAMGHFVASAEGGHLGLEMIRKDHWDLVICDIHMRGMDGFAVASAMKMEPDIPAIPLIAVTAMAMLGDREKMLMAGFDGYISKPIDPETFLPAVEVFLPKSLRSTRLFGQPAVDEATPPPATRAKVLVVDDDPINIHLHISLLQPMGYQVITAEGVNQALVLAMESMPDLIISDVRMRNGTGIDFVRAMKSETDMKRIPIVLISSTYRDEASRQRGLQAGAAKYLFRPIDPHEFLVEIEKCIVK